MEMRLSPIVTELWTCDLVVVGGYICRAAITRFRFVTGIVAYRDIFVEHGARSCAIARAVPNRNSAIRKNATESVAVARVVSNRNAEVSYASTSIARPGPYGQDALVIGT